LAKGIEVGSPSIPGAEIVLYSPMTGKGMFKDKESQNQAMNSDEQ